jgi:hypothetical protein
MPQLTIGARAVTRGELSTYAVVDSPRAAERP